MRIPNWWEAVILAAASWRIWWLIAQDDIAAPLRDRLKPTVVDFVECPYCLGFWITLGFWGAWQAWPHPTLVVASLFALHAGTIAVYKLLDSD